MLRGESMALVTISARIDEKDKAKFDEFCDSVGLNTSIAINLFIKAVLREQRIPFSITTEAPSKGIRETAEESVVMKKKPESFQKYPAIKDLVAEVAEEVEEYRWK